MKKYFILFLVAFSSISYGQVTWQKCFDINNDNDRSHSLSQTYDGGYIIAGYSGGIEKNLFLIKTDSLGDTLWSKIFDAFENLVANSIKQTNDSGYIITGYYAVYNTDNIAMYLAKINSIGDTTWTKTFNGLNSQTGSSAIQTFDNGYILAGTTYSLGNNNPDLYLIKTDFNGDTLWTKTFGGIYSDSGSDIKQVQDSGYIILGTAAPNDTTTDILLIRTNSSGDTLWTKSYGGILIEGGQSIQQTFDNGYIIFGLTNSFGSGDFDTYLIKTNDVGDTLWTKTYGGLNSDIGSSVQETYDSGYILAGYTNSFGAGNNDILLFKTDSLGNLMWSKTYGSSGPDYGNCVLQTIDSGFVICGFGYGLGAFNYDAFFIKTDNLGNSGCRETSPSIIMNNTQTEIKNPVVVISSGGVINHTSIDLLSGTTLTNLCTSTNIFENESSKSGISVFPNPVTNQITILGISGYNVSIQIVNQIGQVVYNCGLLEKNECIIDLNFPSGFYLISVKSAEINEVKKLFVE